MSMMSVRRFGGDGSAMMATLWCLVIEIEIEGWWMVVLDKVGHHTPQCFIMTTVILSPCESELLVVSKAYCISLVS